MSICLYVTVSVATVEVRVVVATVEVVVDTEAVLVMVFLGNGYLLEQYV